MWVGNRVKINYVLEVKSQNYAMPKPRTFHPSLVIFLFSIYNLTFLPVRTLRHLPLAELRLPCVANCNSRRTARRNSISMIWVRLPSNRPIARNVDILILNHRSRCEANRRKPQRVGSGIIGGRKRIGIICIPVSQYIDIACDFDRLAVDGGDDFIEGDCDRGCGCTSRRGRCGRGCCGGSCSRGCNR
jgi:hypothetical protein